MRWSISKQKNLQRHPNVTNSIETLVDTGVFLCHNVFDGWFIMISKEKVRNQVKSRFYYLFWGIATFSVVAGQLYVGSGYRMFAGSLNRIFDTVEIEVGQDYNNERFY